MYTRIITTQLKPGTMDDVISIWREQVIPALQSVQGFKRGYLTGDRNTNKGVIVTFWETEADAAAQTSSGRYQQATEFFTHTFAAPPALEIYEVFVEL